MISNNVEALENARLAPEAELPVIFECAICGGEIYMLEPYWDFDFGPLCKECVDEHMKIVGWNDV